MGYNGGPIDKRFRIVLMKDGGIPQAKSTIQEAGMLKRMDRHELDLKHAKSKSLVAQPCDVGDGHKKEKFRLKKISREDATSDFLMTELDGAYKKAEQQSGCKFTPTRLFNWKGLTIRYPTVKRLFCTTKKPSSGISSKLLVGTKTVNLDTIGMAPSGSC